MTTKYLSGTNWEDILVLENYKLTGVQSMDLEHFLRNKNK